MMATPLHAILIAYSESDFTNPHEAVMAQDPADCRGNFTHMGAKYWGFESKRHKASSIIAAEQSIAYDHNAHGWMQIGLTRRSVIRTITISTKWFTGNQVQSVVVYLRDRLTGAETKVIPRSPLAPDSEHRFDIDGITATECFVECYHDGGLARINLFGDDAAEQLPSWPSLLVDATISHVSNQHYGTPNQTVTGGMRQEMHMVGWESARTGFGEQALFHLKSPATVREVVVDTYLHRLNPPLTSHVFGIHLASGADIDAAMATAPRWKLVFDDGHEVIPDHFRSYMNEQKFLNENRTSFKIRLHHDAGSAWKGILPFAPLAADTFHRFDAIDVGAVTHVLYMHYPNGGIHGLRMYGA